MEVYLKLIEDSANTHTDNIDFSVKVDQDNNRAYLNLDGRVLTVKLSDLQYALEQPFEQ